MASGDDQGTLATEPETLDGAGVVIHGEYLGGKDADSFQRNGETIPVPPKLGLRAGDGTEYQITCSETTLLHYRRNVMKGEQVAVPVVLRPPFGANGPIKFLVRGDDAGGGGAWD